MLQLCAHYRLARMLEREDFRSRLANNLPISVHELLYPLLVAYDSVVLEADVELGATEQKFNLLIGRDIQREYGQPSQVALTMPILVGLDGERKMSKSFGNYVGINEPPGEMFGKLMSISDSLMWSYYELLTDLSSRDLVRLQGEVKDGVVHPMDAKMQLAHIIIAGFQGEAAARKAAVEFRRVFRNREAPEHPIECRIGGVVGGLAMIKIMRGDIVDVHNWPVGSKGKVRLSALLVPLADISSRSEGERLIKQGGVEIDSQRVDDVKREIDLSRPGEFLLRAGKKKFLRIIVE
jgi:tyrosyl-tRNA synthetase